MCRTTFFRRYFRFAQLYNQIESILKSLPKTKNIFDYNVYFYFHDRCIGSHIIFNICIAYTWNFWGRFYCFYLDWSQNWPPIFKESAQFSTPPQLRVFCSPPRGKDQNSESESPFRTLAYRTHFLGGYRRTIDYRTIGIGKLSDYSPIILWFSVLLFFWKWPAIQLILLIITH